jgi:hypothetical protein
MIDDFKETAKAVIEASHQALSIIIVGVGNSDFAEMRKLDSDNQLLEIDEKVCARDIVQFVP